jgi:hypothetical protein
MKEISLTKGCVALVDDQDFDFLNQFSWFVRSPQHAPQLKYAVRMVTVSPAKGGKKSKRRLVSMHQMILKTPSKIRIDHRDTNGLNNQRHNIRIASASQNTANSRKHKDARHSKFKGVCWHIRRHCWTATIRVSGKLINLGRFSKELEAAECYDRAAKKFFGSFARPNFI